MLTEAWLGLGVKSYLDGGSLGKSHVRKMTPHKAQGREGTREPDGQASKTERRQDQTWPPDSTLRGSKRPTVEGRVCVLEPWEPWPPHLGSPGGPVQPAHPREGLLSSL